MGARVEIRFKHEISKTQQERWRISKVWPTRMKASLYYRRNIKQDEEAEEARKRKQQKQIKETDLSPNSPFLKTKKKRGARAFFFLIQDIQGIMLLMSISTHENWIEIESASEK